MEKVTRVNDWIASLPKMRKRRIWTVMIDGVAVQGVSASDNRKATAEKHISAKYPGKTFTLVNPVWRF